MLHRRPARDYETLPVRSEATIRLAMTDLMARRLTGENTISPPPPDAGTRRPNPLRVPREAQLIPCERDRKQPDLLKTAG
nr:hypothetical protein StreXyl84_65750 [Streptomyces sp. Xyl84]